MSKKKLADVKLIVAAGKANPAPPVGTALGPRGVNIMNFCKQFNEETTKLGMEVGSRVPVVISIYEDKSFTFVIKTPPATDLIKKHAGIKKGSSATKKEAFIGEITMDQCFEIAKVKLIDLNTEDLDVAAGMIAGSAESMGLKVIR
jgi:large subunit ribosomal protein L11